MNYSKETKSFVTSLVNNYSQYDNLSESYEIDVDSIDEDDLYKLCALIMRDSPNSAIEATSIDNPAYEESMLPALKYCMAHPSMSFEDEWKKGILSYFHQRIIGLLDDDMEIYSHEVMGAA